MFNPFTGPDSEPLFRTDEMSGRGECDFLECAHLRGTNFLATDMWRVSADGKATIIRSYLEDDSAFVPQLNLTQGTWFSPQMMVGSLAELVRHARGLAKRFNEATSVQFRCECRGVEKDCYVIRLVDVLEKTGQQPTNVLFLARGLLVLFQTP
jgi:hypothetical protein